MYYLPKCLPPPPHQIDNLHAENDDLCDSIRHLEAKVDEKCEQQVKLQSLNRYVEQGTSKSTGKLGQPMGLGFLFQVSQALILD